MKLAFTLALVLATTSIGLAEDDRADNAVEQVQVNPIGKWVWELRFGGRARPRWIYLSADDGELVGVYESPPRPGDNRRRNTGPVPLDNIKLDGDKITFDVTRKFGDREFTTSYAGVIAGDEIAGLSSFNFGGRSREFAWMATRAAEEDLTGAGQGGGEERDQTGAPPAGSEAAAEARSTAAAEDGEAAALSIPAPTRIPDAGEPTAEPYQPRSILPGGIVMPLYPPDSPHLDRERINQPEKYNLSSSVHGRINSIVNIHNPSIEVHFASPSMNTGSVVILAAGGGHRTLNVGTESADFVPYFYNYGVNTVILRNRLRSDGYEPRTDAVRDALQAIRLVRKHAELWKFDPHRIGIMGFSAGAELSAPAAIQFAQFDTENNDADDPLAGISSRPDFVGIIYPGPTPFTREPETEVPRNTPPAFITCAGAGDRIHAIWATDYFSAMLRAGIPNVEMHIYGNGYHPGDRGATGGLTHRSGIPFGKWHERFIEWFDDLGFLSEPGTETKAAQDSEHFVSQPPPRRRGRRRGTGGRRGRPSGQRPPEGGEGRP